MFSLRSFRNQSTRTTNTPKGGTVRDETMIATAATGRHWLEDSGVQTGRILLVVGNSKLCARLFGELSPCGFDVAAAENGVHGFLEFLSTSPDLVVIDLQISGMSSTMLLGEIREREPDLPVILLTDDEAPVVSQVPGVAIAPKSLSPTALASRVSRVLAVSRGNLPTQPKFDSTSAQRDRSNAAPHRCARTRADRRTPGGTSTPHHDG